MKSALILPLVLLLAGCAPQHSYYTADAPHTVNRDQIIAESNRFPTPGHRDTYSWYQQDNTRNMAGPEGVGGDFKYYGTHDYYRGWFGGGW